MKKRSENSKTSADRLVKGIRRQTRKHYSAEEKIRIVLAGLCGEESIAALCRREGIAESLYIRGRRNFWKLVKTGLLVIKLAKQPRSRSKIFALNLWL